MEEALMKKTKIKDKIKIKIKFKIRDQKNLTDKIKIKIKNLNRVVRKEKRSSRRMLPNNSREPKPLEVQVGELA